MKNRQYQGVQLSKKESELIEWLQKGEHNWRDAFYMYFNRRTKSRQIIGDARKEKSWFNYTLRSLKQKGLCSKIPFVIFGFMWKNPGIEASKANFVAQTVQDNFQESKLVHKKIIA